MTLAETIRAALNGGPKTVPQLLLLCPDGTQVGSVRNALYQLGAVAVGAIRSGGMGRPHTLYALEDMTRDP